MLDLAKVRHAFFNPAPEDPERILTREELYTRYELRRVEWCLHRGGNPHREGLSEYGSLIGGPDKPLTRFDYPKARFGHPPRGGPEEAHYFFAALAAGHLAGMPERPTGARLVHTILSSQLKGREWSQVWHILACTRTWDLKRLFSRGGLSVYEVARAIHRSDTCRAEVVTWINQFAVPPSQKEDPGLLPEEAALPMVYEAFHPTHTPRDPEIVDPGLLRHDDDAS